MLRYGQRNEKGGSSTVAPKLICRFTVRNSPLASACRDQGLEGLELTTATGTATAVATTPATTTGLASSIFGAPPKIPWVKTMAFFCADGGAALAVQRR